VPKPSEVWVFAFRRALWRLIITMRPLPRTRPVNSFGRPPQGRACWPALESQCRTQAPYRFRSRRERLVGPDLVGNRSATSKQDPASAGEWCCRHRHTHQITQLRGRVTRRHSIRSESGQHQCQAQTATSARAVISRVLGRLGLFGAKAGETMRLSPACRPAWRLPDRAHG